ncbi:MAG: autotransporter domain-containing protein [Candidatus Omnitrophota bacterium]
MGDKNPKGFDVKSTLRLHKGGESFCLAALFFACSFSAPVFAADLTMTADGIWGETGDVAAAASGDNVNVDNFTLTITNDGIADDGTNPGDLSWFTVGAITDTGLAPARIGNVDIVEAGLDTPLTPYWVEFDSAVIGGDFTVRNVAASDMDVDAWTAGNLTAGGDLAITNNETENYQVTLDVDGNLAVTGTATLTAASGGNWGMTAGLAVTGNVTATGGFTLDDVTAAGVSSYSEILLYGDAGVTQTVTGTIDGAAAGEGYLIIGTGSSNNATFNDDVGSNFSLAAIQVDSTGLANFTGTVSATDLTFSEDGDVDIAGKATITTISTTAGSGTGDVELDGAANVIAGNIGAAGAELALLNIDGTTTTGGNVYATQIDVGAASTLGDAATDVTAANTLNIQHAGLTTVSGTLNSVNGSTGTAVAFSANGDLDIGGAARVASVTTTVAGTGDIEFKGAGSSTIGSIGNPVLDLDVVDFTGGGTYTLVGAVFANTITINNAAANVVIGASGTSSCTDVFLTAGTLDLGSYTTNLAAGDYTQAGAGSLKTTISSSASAGKIVTPGAVTVAAGTSLAINVDSSEYTRSNTTWTILDGGAGGAVNAPAVTDNSAILSFTSAAANAGQDMTITATRVTTYDKIASGNAAAAGAVLERIGEAGATGDMSRVLGELDSLPTLGAIAQALKTVVPVVDSGVTSVSHTAINRFAGTSMNRLEMLFAQAHGAGTEETGISAGSEGHSGWQAWGQGFGEYVSQKARGESNGYRAIIWGTALGADTAAFSDTARIGLNGGYAKSRINSKDMSGKTDINSYEGTFYAGYMDVVNPYYINGALSFAYNKYSGSRQIDIGADERIADADYDGQQYSVLTDGGYIFDVGDYKLTPVASLQYTRLHVEGYTETNAGALDLTVADQDYDMLQSGVGMKLARSFNLENDRIVTPEIHGRWLYDFIGDRQETTSTFSGGGGSFATQGFDPVKSSFNVGTKLIMELNEDWSFETNYDFECKEDFTAHTGWANARCRF